MRFFCVFGDASCFPFCWKLLVAEKKLMDKMLRQPCWVGWFWGFQRVCVFFIERRSSTTWKILVTAEPQGKGGGGSKKKIESLGGMVWKHETCKLAHDQGWWVVGARLGIFFETFRLSILSGGPLGVSCGRWRWWQKTWLVSLWPRAIRGSGEPLPATFGQWQGGTGFMVGGQVASHDARTAITSIPYPSLMEREWLFNHLADECMQYWYKSIPNWRNVAPVWRVRFLQL